MTIGAALRQGGEMLAGAGIDSPSFTAEVLLRHALHCERAWLFAHSPDELAERAWIHYGRFLHERLKGKPTQYITGVQEFYGRTFRVNPAVLIPRPETEHLVAAALQFLESRPGFMMLDVGTGSGAIAVTVALESKGRVVACDVSPPALSVARRNARWLHADVQFFAGDLLSCVKADSMDLIVSNPPYVAQRDAAIMQSEVRDWEPHQALFAGEKGSEVYAKLLQQAHAVLRPTGLLMMELGYDSLPGVRELLVHGWKEVDLIHDLAGWARVLVVAPDSQQ